MYNICPCLKLVRDVFGSCILLDCKMFRAKQLGRRESKLNRCELVHCEPFAGAAKFMGGRNAGVRLKCRQRKFSSPTRDYKTKQRGSSTHHCNFDNGLDDFKLVHSPQQIIATNDSESARSVTKLVRRLEITKLGSWLEITKLISWLEITNSVS